MQSHLPWIISSIINSRNEKSLKQFLIKKGLIKGLGCNVIDHGVMMLVIYLDNFNNWQEIDSYIRYYINSLPNNNWENIIEYFKKKDQFLWGSIQRSNLFKE